MRWNNVLRIAARLTLLLASGGAGCSAESAVDLRPALTAASPADPTADPTADSAPESQPDSAAESEPASVAESAPKLLTGSATGATSRIVAGNVVELRKHLGQTVQVHGRIARVARSKSGHHFLNFANSELTAICFPNDVANFPAGGPAGLFADKDVEVTGVVERYQGKLQIRVRQPNQIRVVAAVVTPATPGITLQKIGRDIWLSPAGLRYQGRDPEGRTRVEHIGRHARDIPDRDGPHGVFDGGEAVALAVIDEAWKLAAQRKLRPDREGDRSSYSVSMGRRVGFLGGRLGAARKHPPLERVFIVFETGTKNIITAFPK